MAFDTKYPPHPLRRCPGPGGDHRGPPPDRSVRRRLPQELRVRRTARLGERRPSGRILARALQCAAPVDGEPCDECPSCLNILRSGSSDSFSEFDAANNSSKEDMRSLVAELAISTWSGNKRLYLIDESHRLSKQALDALLKPMEQEVPDTKGEKELVCIFCTTEPAKMATTIFSRCAPAFTIRPVDPDKIADRLAWVCEQEGKEYDREALVLPRRGLRVPHPGVPQGPSTSW